MHSHSNYKVLILLVKIHCSLKGCKCIIMLLYYHYISGKICSKNYINTINPNDFWDSISSN